MMSLDEEVVALKEEISKLTQLLQFMIQSTIQVYEEELAHGRGVPAMPVREEYQGIN